MTELDLLNLARSATQSEVADFTQVITINFAMVVAIFYFLHQARLPMKLFAFVAYSIGMTLFLGQMLIESNLRTGVMATLAALPRESLSHPTQVYIDVNASWLSDVIAVVFNGAFWVLWLGILALLFFWRRTPANTPD